MPPPDRGYREGLGAHGQAALDQFLSASATGSPEKVRRELAAFIERTGADELMLTSAMFDHQARRRSIQIAAEAMQRLNARG